MSFDINRRIKETFYDLSDCESSDMEAPPRIRESDDESDGTYDNNLPGDYSPRPNSKKTNSDPLSQELSNLSLNDDIYETSTTHSDLSLSEEFQYRQLVDFFPRLFGGGQKKLEDFLEYDTALASESGSQDFMFKLLTVAICNILRHRGIFREEAFDTFHVGITSGKKTRNSVTANVLNLDRPNAPYFVFDKRKAEYVRKRMMAFFDAIEMKYAKQLNFRVASRGLRVGEDRIEVYSFDIDYHNEDTRIHLTKDSKEVSVVNFGSDRAVLMNQCVDFLKNISTWCSRMEPFEENDETYLSIWHHCNENRPRGYLAPGFVRRPIRILPYPHEAIGLGLNSQGQCTRWSEIGNARTNHHQLIAKSAHSRGDFSQSAMFLAFFGPRRIPEFDELEQARTNLPSPTLPLPSNLPVFPQLMAYPFPSYYHTV